MHMGKRGQDSVRGGFGNLHALVEFGPRRPSARPDVADRSQADALWRDGCGAQTTTGPDDQNGHCGHDRQARQDGERDENDLKKNLGGMDDRSGHGRDDDDANEDGGAKTAAAVAGAARWLAHQRPPP